MQTRRNTTVHATELRNRVAMYDDLTAWLARHVVGVWALDDETAARLAEHLVTRCGWRRG